MAAPAACSLRVLGCVPLGCIDSTHLSFGKGRALALPSCHQCLSLFPEKPKIAGLLFHLILTTLHALGSASAGIRHQGRTGSLHAFPLSLSCIPHRFALSKGFTFSPHAESKGGLEAQGQRYLLGCRTIL